MAGMVHAANVYVADKAAFKAYVKSHREYPEYYSAKYIRWY